MNRFKSSTFALVIIITSISLVFCLPSVRAEEDETMGWLEGTVKDVDGNPLNMWYVGLYDSNGNQRTYKDSKGSLGGLYSIRNIKPGVYEVRVYTSQVADRGNELRQQRIWGVAIKKGVRSILDVKLNEGRSRDFEEIGEPSVQTQKVVKLTEEIDQLKAQIEELKK